MKKIKTIFYYMDFKTDTNGAVVVPKQLKKKMFYGNVDTSVMKKWLYDKGSKKSLCQVIISRKVIEE